ncbi:MAG: hypothetical protein JKY66_02670 [Spongiibacteraceae bacterium]|nr:hypothetical protein [Spongiibacteraceae bacterium]
MNHFISVPLTLLLVWFTPVLQAAELIRFISCPVYRDTQAGRKSGCWLADDRKTGVRYDITTSPTKPDWNYAVLVEGLVSDDKDNPCGGKVLQPVRVSILNTSCPRHQLPAEEFSGRPYSLPARNVKPLSVRRDVSPGPYSASTFYIFFDHNKDFIIYQYGDYFLDQAITWIRSAKPKKIKIIGYAATKPEIISTVTVAENPAVGKQRAVKIKEALVRLGVEENTIDVEWKTNPDPIDVDGVDGIPSTSLRRVDIQAMF